MACILDTRTLMVALFFTALVLAVAMTLISRFQHQYPEPHFWAEASWCVILGVGLFILRGLIPNILIGSGGQLGFLRVLCPLIFIDYTAFRCCAVGTILGAFFLYAWDSTAVRIVTFSGCAAVLMLDGA